MSGKKKFKLLDVILSVICVVFVAEIGRASCRERV